MHALFMHCGASSPSPDAEETVDGLDVEQTCAPTHTGWLRRMGEARGAASAAGTAAAATTVTTTAAMTANT